MSDQHPEYIQTFDVVHNRHMAMLSTSIGATISAYLHDDDAVTEICVNDDGSIWTRRAGVFECADGFVTSDDAERVIRLIASMQREVCNAEHPMLSATIPGIQARFQGYLPPLSVRPIFVIRKPARQIYTLADYVAAGQMTQAQATLLHEAVTTQKQNILVVGPTDSGKTTLLNALIDEIAQHCAERIVTIEDTLELQCNVLNSVSLHTRDGIADMRALVKGALRLSPSRIIIGEVRDGAALEMLKAWLTGHPGGLCTIHAESAKDAMIRLEMLCQEVVTTAPKALIGMAIDLVVSMTKRSAGQGRSLAHIEAVQYSSKGYHIKRLA